MSKAFTFGEIGRNLSKILGIENLVDAKIHFPLDGCIRCTAEFYINEIQANAILDLCSDGKWRSEHFTTTEVDTTTLSSTGSYRTFKAGPIDG